MRSLVHQLRAVRSNKGMRAAAALTVAAVTAATLTPPASAQSEAATALAPSAGTQRAG
jgi:hypothetical protein